MPLPRTVLIVDDEPQILRLVRTMLGSRSVNVLIAPLPSEALRISQAQPVHLLISDIAMPEMDGARLAESVLKLHPDASVLLISGQCKEVPATLRSASSQVSAKAVLPLATHPVAARSAA